LRTPKFLSVSQVIAIHQDQVDTFGGSAGIRDRGLLESATLQPQASFDGELLYPTIAEQAAVYLFHLAMNHPFVDGNKRTAFAVMDTFITTNGYSLNLTVDEAYNLVLRVVERHISKEELALYLTDKIQLIQ
jgi:death-on-curing protein